jgi:two-component system CheB/CheR fusion protein
MHTKFPIIAIGASAGGLDPLELFFESLGSKEGHAYVIIQHLAPHHKSLMDELLARYTSLPIHIIEHGMKIKVDRIYLNPPGKFVKIVDGHFLLREKEDRKLSYPISSFLKSLAAYCKEKAAAIVLSGTGSDGSEGIKYIKEEGGLVISQLPETAKFDGMPKNAIHTGSVDKICEVSQMPQEIRRFFDHKLNSNKFDVDLESQPEELTAILEVIKEETGMSFIDYKYSTIYRRTVRRMGILQISGMDEYHQYLVKNPVESHQLASELLIGVTSFFRDEDAFEELRHRVIPRLIDDNTENKSIRIWVPACSTGEEAYTIAILIKEYLRAKNLFYDVVIFATDLNKEAVKFAGNRIFPESISTEIPQEYFQSYFNAKKQGYTVAKEIREMIVFSVHNLIQDPPFRNIDLLSCRNFLIYLNNSIQYNLFNIFQYALNKNGFLFLGPSESLGHMHDQFREISGKNKIYQNINKKKLASRLHLRKKPVLGNKGTEVNTNLSGNSEKHSPSLKRNAIHDLQEAIIQEFVPDTIVFNEDFNLVHSSGQVHRWLKLPKGMINTNVLKMLPPTLELSIDLMSQKVLQSGQPAVLQNIALEEEFEAFDRGGAVGFLEIEIRKLSVENETGLLAATFKVEENRKSGKKFEANLDKASIDKIRALEREFGLNQESLQTTIEELESSNEELQASNEELQSSNEELGSVNEELYTVNAEYMEKVEELSGTNNDLNNLIQSTNIAILFLDGDLVVRKFTPAIKHFLALGPEDIGRHISNFRSKIQLDDFIIKVEEVYETLIPFETTVQDGINLTHTVKISPFLTQKKEVQGVVITFNDISAIYQAKQQISGYHKELAIAQEKYLKQNALFELIAKNSSDMICIHDLEGKIEYVSPAVFDLTGITPKEILKNGLMAYLPKEKDKKNWHDIINTLKQGNNTKTIEYRLKNADDHIRWFESNFKVVTDETGNPVKIISNNRDISGRIRMEKELKQLSNILNHTHLNIVITDAYGRITFVNDAFEKLTGYSEGELLGKVPGELLQGPESSSKAINSMREAIAAQKGFKTEVINYTKDGQKYWVSIHCEPLFENEDMERELIGFISVQYEASLELDYKSQIQELNGILKDKNLKLEGSNKKLDEFAYIASHDLKSPLRNIRSMIQLIDKHRDHSPDKKLNKYFDVMSAAVKEMSRLIDSLLEYSRSGRLDEPLEEVSIKDFEHHIQAVFLPDIQKIGGQLLFNIPFISIKVYPILFKRLFSNLLSNAVKYMGDQVPEISITAEEKDDTYLFAVKDNGMGIPKDEFENIFSIFRSLERKVDNNGIGLAICKTIVELHDGEIWVSSEQGKGSTFYFSIKKFE